MLRRNERKQRCISIHFYYIFFCILASSIMIVFFFFFKQQDPIEGEKADSGQEVVIEEVAGSDEVEMNIARILEKIERFTQQVNFSLTWYGNALRLMLKELSS